MLQANQRQLVFGEANGVHGVADLIHHISHLIVLQVGLKDDQRPLYVIFIEGENVL